MSGSTELESAYVLHARPWQETSQLLEVFGEGHGRQGLVARGARRPKSRWRAVLQPFQLAKLSWSGRGPLHTLRAAESAGWEPPLTGDGLLAGFYCNELLLAFLRRADPHPTLFALYRSVIREMTATGSIEAALRRFELGLLTEVGYGLILDHDVANDSPIDPDRDYEYRVEQGPVPAGSGAKSLVVRGVDLLRLARVDLTDAATLRVAKLLLRAVLAHHLDGRELKTRSVMKRMRQ